MSIKDISVLIERMDSGSSDGPMVIFTRESFVRICGKGKV